VHAGHIRPPEPTCVRAAWAPRSGVEPDFESTIADPNWPAYSLVKYAEVDYASTVTFEPMALHASATRKAVVEHGIAGLIGREQIHGVGGRALGAVQPAAVRFQPAVGQFSSASEPLYTVGVTAVECMRAASWEWAGPRCCPFRRGPWPAAPSDRSRPSKPVRTFGSASSG